MFKHSACVWSDFKQSEFTLRIGIRGKPTSQGVFGDSGITDKALMIKKTGE
jgi:hypothetical protein